MSDTALHRSVLLADRIDAGVHRFAVRHSVTLLRTALAFVFILFGALKFFPGLSPAQHLATLTMERLTLGLLPADTALLAVAVAEVGVGLCLLANRCMHVAVWFLALEMVAILSPLVLLPGALFSGPHHLPSLLGQYILKDFVLLAGVLVLFAARRGGRFTDAPPSRDGADQAASSRIASAASSSESTVRPGPPLLASTRRARATARTRS